MNLTDTLQHWLQGQINAAVSGAMTRLDRLEYDRGSNVQKLNNLYDEVRALAELVTDMEDQNKALCEELVATTLTKSEILADEGKFQQACGLWVARNIDNCVSSLMYDIGRNLEECSRIFDFDYDEAMGWFQTEDWQGPVEQLIADADLDDLERIAEIVGWWSDVVGEFPTATEQEDEDGETFWRADGDRFDDEDEANQDVLERNIDKIRAKVSALITSDEEYREIANAHNLDPEHDEVYEHWTLQERWTAAELEAHGQVVFDFGGLCIWGRTTTGQSTALDHVVREIVSGYDEDHWIWKEVR